MPGFRVTAKTFSVTWPQCELEMETALDQLGKHYPDLAFIAISQEKHQDGNSHLHGLLHFKKKKNIKNIKAFDLQDETTNYHPNIQATKDISSWYEYLIKEGTYIIRINY